MSAPAAEATVARTRGECDPSVTFRPESGEFTTANHDPAADDPWSRRARPTFLYVMYALLLWSVPVGLLAAFSPATAAAITRGMTAYLAAIPEPLYALFATGYLGYTVAREWGKRRPG